MTKWPRSCWLSPLMLLAVTVVLPGCATHRLDTTVESTPSQALAPATEGPAQELASRLANGHQRYRSSFLLLTDNLESLRWRILLADMATHSIDVQYYLIDRDDSSRLFSLALARAANRGVRVRLLVDDVFLMNRERNIAIWNDHPNVEIRVFNPWHKRGSLIQKGLEWIGYTERLNQRMHNKLFAVDNRIAVVGGRNIGDAYYGMSDKYNFRDLDVIATGPIVDKVSYSFDLYWNNEWSVSAAAFYQAREDDPTRDEIRRAIEETLRTSPLVRELGLLETGDRQAMLQQLIEDSVYGQAWAVYDAPPSDVDAEIGVRKIRQLEDLDADIERELLLTSPYFVPSRILLEKLTALTERGVRVRILTNSLASTNHTICHSGYRPSRRKLLNAGIELYEYRADAQDRAAVVAPGAGQGFTSLHSKTFVIDREVVYVGSLNMDPRSFHLNTEMGLLVTSPVLASQVADAVEQDMAPENAWQVKVDEEGKLYWVSGDRKTHLQPARGPGQRIADFFYGLLPIKDQL